MNNCDDLVFNPKKPQIKFAEVFLDTDGKKSRKEIAKKIGVHQNTITNWFKDKNFVKWINSKNDEMLDNSLADRYKTAVRKAKAGDFQFSKLLFEMQGEYVQKSESKITQVKDDLENLTMDELIKEFEHDLDIYRARTDKSKDNGSKSKRAKKG